VESKAEKAIQEKYTDIGKVATYPASKTKTLFESPHADREHLEINLLAV